MRRACLVVAFAGAALLAASVHTLCAADTVAPTFKRGATLVEFFEFPATTGDGTAKAYAVPAFPDPLAALKLFDFDELHRIGFDHMRVPLDVGPLIQADEGQRRKILEQLVAVVSEINRHGLAVLVTLFPPSLQQELPETYLDGLGGPKFRVYSAEVERVARALATVRSGLVALEPMNEPQSKCRVVFGTDWSAYQQVMIESIRHISAQLPLFLTGGCCRISKASPISTPICCMTRATSSVSTSTIRSCSRIRVRRGRSRISPAPSACLIRPQREISTKRSI